MDSEQLTRLKQIQETVKDEEFKSIIDKRIKTIERNETVLKQ